MNDPNDTPLWLFSLEFYAHDHVSECLLAIQDSSKANVNIILYLLWLASNFKQLSKTEISSIINSTENWTQNVVIQIREVRRYLKLMHRSAVRLPILSFKDKVKELEIQAEKIEQMLFYQMEVESPFGMPVNDAILAGRENLRSYEQLLQRPFPPERFNWLLNAFQDKLDAL